MMKRLTLLCAGLSLLSGCASTLPPSPPKEAAKSWSFWIEQDGKVHAPDQPIVLARKPFVIRFRGAPDDDYGLAATPVREELAVSGDLAPIFRVSNGLLVDEPNTKISINSPGLIGKHASSWNMWAHHTPQEVGLISSFQSRTANADQTVTLSRTVDTLCVDDGQRHACRAVASPVFRSFHGLVTRIPQLRPGQSAQDVRWLDPTPVSIQFQ